jgi:flagellar protein FlaG
MSAESISNALFLIAAVICAAVLIVAIFPAIYTMTGTFGSASHAADQNIRTDFTIVFTGYNSVSGVVTVYMKNVGTAQISSANIESSDVVCGGSADFGRISSSYWTPELCPAQSDCTPLVGNSYWNPGETLGITIQLPQQNLPSSANDNIYFQFILPNGVSRSLTFPQSITG